MHGFFGLGKTLRELVSSEIKDLMHGRVSVFNPDDTASKVLGELKETGRYEAAVASEGGIGLVTVRDLLGVSQPAQTRVDGIWKIIGSASPRDEVMDVVLTMVRNNVRAIPVVQDGMVVGIVSQVDVTSALSDVTELSGIAVKGLMRTPVTSLDIDERVSYARRLMLEKGFSHIPIVEYNRLVGIVTAKDIVHAYITPISKTTTGARVGEKIARFPGMVSGIMDPQPLTVGADGSALDVARGLREQVKSACVVTDLRRAILGIITPRELLAPLLRFREEEELPIYIMGLSGTGLEKAIAEQKVRRVVERSLKIHPHINEVSVRVKQSKTRGTQTRHEVTARVLSAEEQFIAEEEGWDILKVFDKLCDTLDNALKKSKHEPERSPRRRRFRR